MTELGPTERRLLQALRAADEPTDADRARVRARLTAKIAAATGAASAVTMTSAAAATPGAAAGIAAGWKVGTIVIAVLGAAGGAAWFAHGKSEESPALVAPQTANRMPAFTPPVQATERAATPPPERDRETANDSVVTPRAARQSSPTTKPGAEARQDAADLDKELALLERAQRALRQGDAAGALAELERHSADHPTGALAVERQGIRAVALCESGNAEGPREARRFLARNPKSPLAIRVRAACFGAKK